MRYKSIISISALLMSVALAIPFFHGYASETSGDITNQRDTLQDRIEELTKVLETLKGQGQSLRREIEYADAQIELTQAKIQRAVAEIENKNAQINQLTENIDDLGVKIAELEEKVRHQEDILKKRLRLRYEVGDTSPFVMVFGSSTFNSLVQKSEYLRVIQLKDKKLLDQMTATRNNLDQRKYTIEVNREQVAALREQIVSEKTNLESYRANLERQKRDKQVLLDKTENDEEKYQALLEQVKSELAALQLAIDLPEGEGEPVEEGDVIGYMGNTGCSSGPHVHFGYVKGGRAIDPLPYLKKGELKWPIDNPAVTQDFGANYSFYMNNFGIPGHDAIDIAIAGCPGCGGAPVKAAKAGKLHYANDSKVYCSWLNNSIGKGAIIDHGDGKRTIYWHLK